MKNKKFILIILTICFIFSFAVGVSAEESKPKKLDLSEDKVIGGVCAGIAEYIGIDATIVRIAFVFFTLAGGAGVVIYLVLWAIMSL